MSDTSTRSGLLWEVERILGELKEKPQILLMENVPQVHSQDNIQDFKKWILKLEELGYKNYFQDLIATDYGIPQTRTRCFMISILGDYNYTFPNKQQLKLKLKDLLEDNVEGKYYLKPVALEGLQRQMAKAHKPKFIDTSKEPNKPFSTITAGYKKQGHYETYLIDNRYYLSEKMKKYIISEDDKYKVNKNKLTINRDLACSKTTREGNTRADTSDYICRDLPENYNLITKDENEDVNKIKNLKIRKLTPKECFRLMGVKDEDFEKCARNQSDGSLYHLAGDSIVVNVLMAIFGQLL